MYQKLFNFAKRFVSKAFIFKFGFNISPMYSRSTAKVIEVSDDLLRVKVKIPLSWKNKNYVGSIFGGSLFSATDPIYMIQLIQILGDDFVVWDKSTNIRFRRPARADSYAEFIFSEEEIENIKSQVAEKQQIDYTKPLIITDANKTVFVELEKTLYIADKNFYKEKSRLKQEKTQN